MAPKKPQPTISTLTTAITTNWNISNPRDSLPKTHWPENEPDATKWGLPILILIQQISVFPAATIKDFRSRLRVAIKGRQERNTSAAGKVNYVKASDLRSVLAQYTKEEEQATSPQQTKKRAHPNDPKTPARSPVDLDEEEEEDSDACIGGRYYHHGRVKAIKADLQADASAAAKPKNVKPKPMTRRQKRGRDVVKEEEKEEEEKPSLVHQDPDPRLPDDTGFLSPLVLVKQEDNNTVENSKSKRPRGSKRLSRLQQECVREPHWQIDPPEPTPVNDQTTRADHEISPLQPLPSTDEDVSYSDSDPDPDPDSDPDSDNVDLDSIPPLRPADTHPSHVDSDSDSDPVSDPVSAPDLDLDADSILASLPPIPPTATVRVRREMEELRLYMEKRVWTIKVLKASEMEGGGDENAVEVLERAGKGDGKEVGRRRLRGRRRV